jgi:hypothetical protein
MAITRTPMVDDDGSGQSGTVVNNAWKSELYDQIDGALGPAGAIPAPGAAGNLMTSTGAAWQSAPPRAPLLELLHTVASVVTPTGAINMATVPLSGLDLRDTIEIFWDLWVAGAAPVGSLQFDLYNGGPTPGQLLTLVGADAGGDVSGYATASYYIQLRCLAGYPGLIGATATAAPTIGAPQSRGFTWGRNSAIAAWNGSWPLLLRCLTSSAGTPLNFSIQVYRRRGGTGLSDRLDEDQTFGDPAPVEPSS